MERSRGRTGWFDRLKVMRGPSESRKLTWDGAGARSMKMVCTCPFAFAVGRWLD